MRGSRTNTDCAGVTVALLLVKKIHSGINVNGQTSENSKTNDTKSISMEQKNKHSWLVVGGASICFNIDNVLVHRATSAQFCA